MKFKFRQMFNQFNQTEFIKFLYFCTWLRDLAPRQWRLQGPLGSGPGSQCEEYDTEQTSTQAGGETNLSCISYHFAASGLSGRAQKGINRQMFNQFNQIYLNLM